MKTYKHLMTEYLSEENYYEAVRNATRHKSGAKRKNRKARRIRNNAEEYKNFFLDYAEHFKNKNHTPVLIYDGVRRKQRSIIVPTIEEQVVHHMMVNVLKPMFTRGMYEHSYGSIPGRGATSGRNKNTSGGKETIEKWIRSDRKNMKYCLKMDIKKYFDSIPHDILRSKFEAVIKDKDFLDIIYEVIDASPNGVGIPIGFYTSQWIANWYLSGLDHYIKEDLKAVHYIRYMDDMVIFGSNKKRLHEMQKNVAVYLESELGLEMKANWQVFRFDFISNGEHKGRDLDFMGFRFYRDRTVLRKTVMHNITRKAKRLAKKPKLTIYDCRQMIAYLGRIDASDTYDMYKKRVKPYISFQKLKRIESYQQRRINKCGTK